MLHASIVMVSLLSQKVLMTDSVALIAELAHLDPLADLADIALQSLIHFRDRFAVTAVNHLTNVAYVTLDVHHCVEVYALVVFNSNKCQHNRNLSHSLTLAQATGKEKDDQPLYPWTATGDALEPNDRRENERGDP